MCRCDIPGDVRAAHFVFSLSLSLSLPPSPLFNDSDLPFHSAHILRYRTPRIFSVSLDNHAGVIYRGTFGLHISYSLDGSDLYLLILRNEFAALVSRLRSQIDRANRPRTGVIYRGTFGLHISYSLDGSDLYSIAGLCPHPQVLSCKRL